MNLPIEEKGDDGMVRIELSANEAEILSECDIGVAQDFSLPAHGLFASS